MSCAIWPIRAFTIATSGKRRRSGQPLPHPGIHEGLRIRFDNPQDRQSRFAQLFDSC
jgi:hypothetical protein